MWLGWWVQRAVVAVDCGGMTLSGLVSSSGARGDMVIARKVLDAMEAEGAAAVKMIRDAAEVGKAQRGAVSSRAGAGETGQTLDVSA